LQVKKGVQNRYSTLLARDVLNVQTAHLKTRFELAPASTVAEKTASLTNQALRGWEKSQGPGACGPESFSWSGTASPSYCHSLPRRPSGSFPGA
jgi:hypothetical protein